MKLLAFCAECPPDAHGRTEASLYAEITDENVLELRCANGHHTFAALQQPRFELLFQSGALALLDGYTREAVSSFAVAMERFHEYWIHVTLLQAGYDAPSIAAAWKPMARQSERQYGAFLALYFHERKAPAPTIAQKWVEFRNEITHKGYWPTVGDARLYGEAVLNYVSPLLKDLRERSPEGYVKALAEQVRAANEKTPESSGVTMGIMTILQRAAACEPGTAKFDTYLDELKQQKGIYWR